MTDTVREEFEKWADSVHLSTERAGVFYSSDSTLWAWEAWQAQNTRAQAETITPANTAQEVVCKYKMSIKDNYGVYDSVEDWRRLSPSQPRQMTVEEVALHLDETCSEIDRFAAEEVALELAKLGAIKITEEV